MLDEASLFDKSYVSSALKKSFKATNVSFAQDKKCNQIVTFTAKEKSISRTKIRKAIDHQKFEVWKIRKKTTTLPDKWSDGTMHLLLLRQHGPYVRA